MRAFWGYGLHLRFSDVNRTVLGKPATEGESPTDSRKMGKLLDQLIDMTAVVFHQNGRPPPSPPRPPVSLDITAVDSSSTLRSASFVAATMRSSSISMSSGSTTSS